MTVQLVLNSTIVFNSCLTVVYLALYNDVSSIFTVIPVVENSPSGSE